MRKESFISVFICMLVIFMPVSYVRALAITNVTSDAGSSSAVIKWETGSEALGRVDYGPTVSLGQSAVHDSYAVSHSIGLFGLEDGTKYYFRVSSTNSSGYTAIDTNYGNYYSFTTKDTTPPERVERLEESNSGLHFIKLEWQDTGASDFLKYIVYRDDINVANTTLSEYTDSSLQPDTAYNYKVAAMDTSGNIGTASAIKQLRTAIPDYRQPEISELGLEELSYNKAKITWLTDENSNTVLHFGLNANVENTITKNESVTKHIVDLQNLLNSTPYFYKAVSCDASNNCAESDIQNFKTGIDLEPPEIEVNLPEWHNSNRIDVTGSTESFARVRVYVNGELKRAMNTEAGGKFAFKGVSIDTSISSNFIKVIAVDQVGFESLVEKEVKVDTVPPTINITQFSKYTHEEDTILDGFVDEEISLEIAVVQGSQKKEFLPKVTGLRIVEQESNSIELEWDSVEDEELAGYLIYRNGKRMTSYSDNYFVDPLLDKSKQYSYAVSAYSHKCIEGEKSEPITVSTSDQAAEFDDSFEELNNFCTIDESSYSAMLVSGKFSRSLDLVEGKNLIIINATDKAGNTVIIEQETIVDTEKPEILQHNLDSLDPSYIRDVTIKGKVSKKQDQEIIVKVIINEDEVYSGLAGEDGTFSVHAQLQRKVREEMNEEQDYDPERRVSNYYSSYGVGAAWDNDIRIIALTESGLESEPVERNIKLATCGYGSWWSIRLGEPSPNILTPRLMLEGLAQIGIPVTDIRWQGGSKNGSLNYVDVTEDVPLNAEDLERYDLDWVRDVQYIHSGDMKKGYVLITLKKLDSSRIFTGAEGYAEGAGDDGMTTLEMENFLSRHRKNEDCLAPGLGCFRIPLMMEIDFSRENGSVYLGRERAEIELTKQRQCWDVEVSIDQRLPSDQIPEEFLRSSIELLSQTINAVEQLLEPLNTIKQVLFYGCAASIIMDYTMAFQESFHCEFSEALNTFSESEGPKFQKYYAQTGQCDIYDSEQKEVCLRCEEAVSGRKQFEKNMKAVCDRIFCPSAPTFQKYVKDQSENKDSASKARNEEQVVSDCAYGQRYMDKLNYESIFDIYEAYQDQKESDEEDNECAGLHPPTNECCAYEYMENWDSACMIMDELKESKCVALEDSDKSVNDDTDCGSARKIWNSIAGFCEPDGTAPAEIVPAHDTFKNEEVLKRIMPDAYDEQTNKKIYVAGSSNNEVWLRFLPEHSSQRTFGGDNTGNIYWAEIGYIDEDLEKIQTNWRRGEASKVATARVFRPLQKYLLPVDVTTTERHSNDYNEQAEEYFITNYKEAAGTEDEAKIRQIYRELQQRLGVTDKDYIVDPSSGLLRSFQCVCLPAITSYLNLWKKILEAVRTCFQTVLVTGDGSAGICKAVLSVYVCDLIYDLISCFKQKYGIGYKREYSGGIGNFFGALTSAGEKVSNSVESRYGDSPIWRSIFSERKLVHSACLWAFTGTWDFDVTAVLEEDVSVDVQTVALLYPCERRFISFNPATNPSGLTTYNYHLGLGIVAGSKMDYHIELVCSDDYSCSTPTGECDCVSIGTRTRHIVAGPGRADRGEVIEEEVYENIMNAPYRYDKAIIRWSSHADEYTSGEPKSGQVECRIKDAGGKPPAFCQLDIAEGRYRCELGFNEEDYIRFYNTPTPDRNEYTVGDHINVDLRLAQRQPSEVEEKYSGREWNPYTKYMKMTLYNQNNAEIASW
ncbi:hypothetical protein GF323_04145, partial [Candidatus Woesearchaeota archaeon]|nr:hypothetical protein [Candidatus Woesearchaeota archaeon]